jgi:spermidine/putrescine transport system substrate-binding protein
MLSKLGLGAGEFDLIQPSEYVVAQLIKDGRLEELDHAKIPNIKNLSPEFRNLEFDPNNKHSVTWMAGTVGIAVNTKEVKKPITGYKDLFVDELKGKIVVLDDSRELVSWALAYLGKDQNDVTPENLTAARGVLERWLPLVRVFDSDSPKQAFLNGDVVAGLVWSGEGALLYREDPETFKWVLPVEGTHLFIDSLCIPKGAKNKDAAMQFINFILEPEISKMISADFPYLNPNAEAKKLLDEADRNNPASFPTPEEFKRLGLFKPLTQEQSQAIDKLVTDLRAE